jgi:hypothetical protein
MLKKLKLNKFNFYKKKIYLITKRIYKLTQKKMSKNNKINKCNLMIDKKREMLKRIYLK